MTKPIEALERFFRKKLVYPLLRMIFRNPVLDAPIDLHRVKRILILRYDRIGDMIVTTPILRTLKQQYPHIRLDVLASKVNAEVVQRSPLVDNLMIIETNWVRLLRQIVHLRKQRYDVVLNFIFNRTTGPGILANLVAPNGCKVGQGPDRYAFYFNRLVKVRRFEQHMLESYVSFVEQAFGISVQREELTFQIAIGADAKRTVDDWLQKQILHRRSEPKSPGLPYLILNPSGKDMDRSLEARQVAALVKNLSEKPDFRVVVLDAPGNKATSEAICTESDFLKSLVYRTLSSKPLGELASLIEGAFLVISPDTSIVHFASAMQTPVLAIYAPVNASQEWLPHKVPYDVVMAKGEQRISDIEPQVLIDGADRFIARVLEMKRAQSRELK
ncbi:MAG: glycosyltransferase family 9 protein [Ignavibacteriales bacterium]|nr:glycosyltransferase family 9 protein [Ignavibacteriales bacterium]